MNSKLIIGIVVAVVVIGAAALLLMPPAPSLELGEADIPAYEDEVSIDYRSMNADLYAGLVSAGFNDPFVDVTEERVYVAYDLPEGYEADSAQRFVIGAAADTGFDLGQVIVTQYQNEEPVTVWTVEMADFKAFMMDEMTGEELDAKIVKQAL